MVPRDGATHPPTRRTDVNDHDQEQTTQAAVDAAPAYPAVQRVRGPRIARGALVVAATTAVVLSAAAVFAATPTTAPAATDDAGASTEPSANTDEERIDVWPGRPGHPDMLGGGFIGGPFLGRFEITVASVNGTQVALETANGWSRTVDATGVTITRGDEEIALSEIQPGDQVVLGEERNDDGTWSVTAIHVVLPHVGGIVTDVSADSITVEQPDGTIATIAVTDETTYTVPGTQDAGLRDIDVDDVALARGTLDADGTLVATDVWGGVGAGLRGRFEGRFHLPFAPGDPSASDDGTNEGTDDTSS
jgi:hypothetical protein